MTLGIFPTPLQAFPSTSGGPKLLVKREDLSGVGFGGNKVRKLRALLSQAKAQGADVVLTWGGLQSNHCALTACAAPLYGLRAELFFQAQPPPCAKESAGGNQRIHSLLKARCHFVGPRSEEEMEAAMQARAAQLRQEGQTPFLISLGGSDPLGVLSYAHAVGELSEQLAGQAAPAHMVVSAGSLGTMAGIVLGTWVYGLDTQVDGYTVLFPLEQAHERLEALLESAFSTLSAQFPALKRRPNYALQDTQLGEGYGVPTPAGQAAAAQAAARYGLMLDQTYTAKSFAGLLAGLEGRYAKAPSVLYWHTGGAGGFFA